jgi:hypothetical protein
MSTNKFSSEEKIIIIKEYMAGVTSSKKDVDIYEMRESLQYSYSGIIKATQ